jgi:hypothetical protein
MNNSGPSIPKSFAVFQRFTSTIRFPPRRTTRTAFALIQPLGARLILTLDRFAFGFARFRFETVRFTVRRFRFAAITRSSRIYQRAPHGACAHKKALFEWARCPA